MSDAILHVETRHRRGGGERNVNHFTAWQATHGHRVGLAVGQDSLLDEVPSAIQGILVPNLVRRPDPIRDPLVTRDLRRLIVTGGWNVVHTHQSKAGVVGRIAARGRARLVIHTVHMHSFGPGYGPIASTLFERAERWTARWTDELIAVGDELRERYLAAGIGSPGRFRVIRSPIDLDAFVGKRDWTTDRRRESRERLGIPHDRPVILTVAALEPRKRVGLIIERLADDLRDSWTMLVAGDGRLRDRLQRHVDRAGLARRVILLGTRADVPELMASADLLVHAAEAEGVPQVVIQALAAGLPVVATDMIGLREVSGAPIVIGAADGSDLRARVARSLRSPLVSIPPDALRPWSAEAVEAEIVRLHRDLGLTR